MDEWSRAWLGVLEAPVDWKGIAYVLGGVVVAVSGALSGVIVKLYKDLKTCRREQMAQAVEQERYLKGLLDDLK